MSQKLVFRENQGYFSNMKNSLRLIERRAKIFFMTDDFCDIIDNGVNRQRTWNHLMKARLTLQEKLRDLRDEKKLTLTGLSEAIGIPTATL